MTKHKCSELPALIDLNVVEILRYPSIEETTKEWLEGQGVGGLMFTQQHPDALGVCKVNVFGHECCPDFSCCKPELLWPKDVRQSFYDAWKSGANVGDFLSQAMSSLLDTETTPVHVAGLDKQVH